MHRLSLLALVAATCGTWLPARAVRGQEHSWPAARRARHVARAAAGPAETVDRAASPQAAAALTVELIDRR